MWLQQETVENSVNRLKQKPCRLFSQAGLMTKVSDLQNMVQPVNITIVITLKAKP